MVRTISDTLKAHFQGNLLTITTMWRITRTDGTVMGFTAHDKDLIYDSVTYKAATGFNPSDVALKNDFSVSNMDVTGLLDSEEITESDIMGGKYDYAEVLMFFVNYEDLTQGSLILQFGHLGQVELVKDQFTAEIRGISQNLQQIIGDTYGPSCRAIFGDSKCGIDITSYTISSAVTSVLSKQIIVSSGLTQDSSYFANGKISFTSGLNSGFSMEVKEFASGEVVMAMAMPFTISVGDTFTIVAGCDKTFNTCRSTFNNSLNFRGEPYLPGMDKMLETSGTYSTS